MWVITLCVGTLLTPFWQVTEHILLPNDSASAPGAVWALAIVMK